MQEMQEMQVQFLGRDDPLEEGMAIRSFSCLGSLMDRGTWQATVHRVAKSQTPLKLLSTHASMYAIILKITL